MLAGREFQASWEAGRFCFHPFLGYPFCSSCLALQGSLGRVLQASESVLALPTTSHSSGRACCSELATYCKQEKPSLLLSRVKKQDSAGKISQMGWKGSLLKRTLRLTHGLHPHPVKCGAVPPSSGRSSMDSNGQFMALPLEKSPLGLPLIQKKAIPDKGWPF